MKSKTIFISGASSGIGQETAYRFAAAGSDIVLTYNRHKKDGEQTRERCLASGSQEVLLIKLDVMDNKSIASAVKQTRKVFGNIDILINNAGTGVVKPFDDSTLKDIEQQLRTNLEGLIKVTHAFMPYTKEAVINIGSFLSKNAYANMAVYCASKYGVRGFTQALAQEQSGLRICCVHPDLTATALTGGQGRPPSAIADIIFRAAANKIKVKNGGDIDVWEILK
jgi:NAD(P)-dependent dehydrogenase (short-subunit alcohol dehydrogenase family)